MAIELPGDLLLDVARAAPAADGEAARARLAKAAPAVDGVFERAIGAPPQTRGVSSQAEAYVKFEAMMLQTFVQSMLPKEHESVYGDGLAGEMWQSMLAEKIAGEMARAGGIGIADRILHHHYVEGDRTVPLSGSDTPAESAEKARRSMVAQTILHEAERLISQPPADLARTAARG